MDKAGTISPEIVKAANEVNAAANEAETPSNKPEKTSKSKKGLIIGIAAGVVVIGGSVGVAYAVSNTPENIALSAISGLFNQKEKSISGTFELSIKDGGGLYSNLGNSNLTDNCLKTAQATNCLVAQRNPLESVKIELKSANSLDNGEASASLSVVYDGKTYNISLGTVLIKDYTVYISINGLKEALAKYDGVDFFGDSVISAELYQDLIEKTVSEIDGTWWKIDISDLVNAVDTISNEEKEKIKSTYQCLIDETRKSVNESSKYGDYYKNNAFVSISDYKGGKTFSSEGTPYAVKLDSAKFANFYNEIVDHYDDSKLKDCLGSLNETVAEKPAKISAEAVDKAIKDIPEIVITIKNGLFSHDLTGVYIEADNEFANAKFSAKFDKLKNKIEAPSDAKDATELLTNITKTFNEWQETAQCKYIKKEYPQYFNYYCDANYHSKTNYTVQNNYNI